MVLHVLAQSIFNNWLLFLPRQGAVDFEVLFELDWNHQAQLGLFLGIRHDDLLVFLFTSLLVYEFMVNVDVEVYVSEGESSVLLDLLIGMDS